jgi:hypothetical protein
VVARRHDNADLLGLARDGSAPALASLLHRHRATVQRAAARAADPERAAGAAMTAAVRALRAGRLRDPDDLPGVLEEAAAAVAVRAPRTVDVEPLLPADWFDRAWVDAGRTWPTGRRPLPRPPRWVLHVTAALALAAVGAGGTWLALSSDGDREVLGSIVASTLEGPSALDDAPPVPEPVVEEAPELFGDVEIGSLPTYDLTTRPGTTTGTGPELAPPTG